MRVDAISVRNYPNQQNFKGLYKKVEEVKDETYYEPAYEADLGTFTNRTTIYYYPFADDDDYEIKRFVSHNTFKRVTEPSNPNLCDQITRVQEGIVYVQNPLNITSGQYREYKESMENAKKLYAEKQEIARRAAIRALAPKEALEVEKNLNTAGLNEWVIN